MKEWLNVDDIPVLCPNVPDYREEAFEQAKKDAKVFGVSYVLYDGTYYHATSSEHGRIYWQKHGCKVIHTEKREPKRV